MQLIDTHCHLNHPPLNADTAGVLERARSAGVTRVVVPAYDAPCWGDLAKLARQPGVAVALGLHPWLAHDLTAQASAVTGGDAGSAATGTRALTGATSPGVALATDRESALDRLLEALATRLASDASRPVAIGEIGLDTKISASGLELQVPLLERQLNLAADLDLPVILHCRGAFEELLAAVNRHGGRLRGVLHAYSRGPELAERFIGAGLHIALGGAVTRARARQVRRAAVTIPLERLLLETDAPSIGLEDVAPERTEPRHVHDVARAVALLRGESPEAIAAVTTANAESLFGLTGR